MDDMNPLSTALFKIIQNQNSFNIFILFILIINIEKKKQTLLQEMHECLTLKGKIII